MFGAKQSFRRLCDQINEAVARAEALLEENPNDPKALKILEAVDHTMNCLEAFTFGRKP